MSEAPQAVRRPVDRQEPVPGAAPARQPSRTRRIILTIAAGSLALLIDLGGDDHYTCGATNGAALQRPDYGVVYHPE